MKIVVDDLKGSEIIKLLEEHLLSMKEHSPQESIHALDLDELRKSDITFWSVWESSELLGCGALKELSSQNGEIKSMRTVSQHQGKGVAARLLSHVIEESKKRNYRRLNLETGSMKAFMPACNLYIKFGFKECLPFASYVEDPNSLYMVKEL